MTIPRTSDDDDGAGAQDATARDRNLVAAMRRGDRRAFTEFFLCFAPLLTAEARRLRVSVGEQDALVNELLDDAVLRLIEPNAHTPRSLAAYLATSLRRRVLNARRAAMRRVRMVREAAPGILDTASATSRALVESDVSALCSEGTRRASAGPGVDVVPVAGPVMRLAESIARDLSAEEQRLLEWAGNHVPQREIAVWLGIGYEAAGKRIRRLRARLLASSAAYLAALDPADRSVLGRLIERGAPVPTSQANGESHE